MRIALVTNGLRFGGAERIVQALAEDLMETGHTVRVIATTRDGPIGDALRAHGVPVDVLGLKSAVDLRVPVALSALLRQFRPDVVHSHLAVADIACTAVQAPGRVCTVHNPGVELGRLKRWLWHRALPRFRVVTAVSEAVQRSLPVPARVIRPSLVDGCPAIGRAEARRRLGLAPHDRIVLGVGRLSPVKGFDLLATIAPRLTGRVAVIGEGPQRASLAGRIDLLGARADAAETIAAADVLVMPSRSEGFPQVPLQAMAAGVPVVATRVGGTPEIVVHEGTGLLVAPEDPDALAMAIQRLLDEPEWARQLGQAGRQRLTAANFTRTAMLDATVSLYRDVVAQ